MSASSLENSSFTGAVGETDELSFEPAREMRRRWRSGEQPLAEEFLIAHPELAGRPEAAVELIYEEYCLRQAAGNEGVEQDLFNRFPQWRGPLRVMLDCHRSVLQSERDQPSYPGVGEVVGDFRLLADLGRGSHGRVFVAAQMALADRLVVLKITALESGEHLSLARLQHTNIVPLYAVIDDPTRGVRVLCMPYFGRATLASMLDSLANIPASQRTGRHIVDFIDQTQQPSRAAPPVTGAVREMLASVSYVQAICWIVAALADALHFAHERGLVHLDLKPSNVLLSIDGQPMLLDFHLARGAIVPHGAIPDSLGGTPPYMAPEQQAVMDSLRNGEASDVAIDRRADLYALGAMLHEVVAGRHPHPPDAKALARVNPQVSPGLCDIIAKCIEPNASMRYEDAAKLADDLRRHLTDQPLAGVRNRSISERWRKWRRRRPGALRGTAIVILIAASAFIALYAVLWYVHDRRQLIERAILDGQRQMQAGVSPGEAVRTFECARDLARGMPLGLGTELQRRSTQQLAAATRLQLTSHLHLLAEEIRALGGSDAIPPARLAPLTAKCDALWDKRGAILNAVGDKRERQLADDMLDIAIFAADVQATTDLSKALQLLDDAEATFGPSAALAQERQSLASARPPPQDNRPKARLPFPSPHTAWEHCVLGRTFLRSGDLSQAANELRIAVALDPAGRWPNFYYGICASRTGRHEDAVAAISTAIGTAPDVAGFYYYRALAYTALGRTNSASQDYDRALQLDSSFAALNVTAPPPKR